MPLIQILVLLIIVGVVLFLINQYIPMAASIKSILNAVVVIAVIVWLLNVFGSPLIPPQASYRLKIKWDAIPRSLPLGLCLPLYSCPGPSVRFSEANAGALLGESERRQIPNLRS